MLIPMVSEARFESARGRMQAACAPIAARTGTGMTWFGILLDAARARNRIGQRWKTARNTRANAATAQSARAPRALRR